MRFSKEIPENAVWIPQLHHLTMIVTKLGEGKGWCIIFSLKGSLSAHVKCQTCFIDFIASTLTLLQRLLVLWRQWLMRILGLLQKPITLEKKFNLAFLSFWKVWHLFWAAVAANEEFGKTDTTSVAVSAVHSIRAAKTKSCSNKPQGILSFQGQSISAKHFRSRIYQKMENRELIIAMKMSTQEKNRTPKFVFGLKYLRWKEWAMSIPGH